MGPMSATRATTSLDGAGIAYREHAYEMPGPAPGTSGGAYGVAVAAAIGFETARVFKTLVAEVDGSPAVGIVPVDRTLRLKSLAAALGGKRAAMAGAADAERWTGYVTGGISPFGRRTAMPVVLDTSALQWETVCVSGGRRGLQLEVAPEDLAAHVGAVVAAISS
ncbi:MAG: Cys-tRNA(Pro) deacylase [Actinobacteria bacterium]|nr:Cys-tRNA(Pro) deacylase [Actinomycetota bacterium]